MATELRIPPSVTFAFERTATQVCNEAKLDYDEWSLRAYEAVTHLRESWRKGIRNGLSTDEAERQALVSYGDLSIAAKSWRKSWLLRMLFHQRCRSERFFLFLAAYVFFSWLAVLDVHFRAYLDGKGIDLHQLMLPFNPAALGDRSEIPKVAQIISFLVRPGFFIDGLGTFFVGLAAVASVVTIQLQFHFKKPLLNQVFVSRYLLSVVALFAIVTLAIWPAYLTWITFTHYEDSLFYQGYCVMHIGAIFFGWFGAACLISELFDLPGMMRRKHRDRNSPFAVVV